MVGKVGHLYKAVIRPPLSYSIIVIVLTHRQGTVAQGRTTSGKAVSLPSVKEAHSCLFKEANYDNVKRSSVPVVAEGWGGMHFVARAPTKKPAKFHPPPTFPSWGKSDRKFRPPNPPPL